MVVAKMPKDAGRVSLVAESATSLASVRPALERGAFESVN